MRLLSRLALTILSLLLILTMSYLALPFLIAGFARHQLLQQGFTNIDITVGPIGLQSAKIEQVQMSKPNLVIKMQNMQADYQLKKLLSGTLESIQIETISLIRIPGEAGTTSISLPAPKLLSVALSLAWHEMMPARSLKFKKLSLYEVEGALSLSASGELHKQGETISGNIRLLDSHNTLHRISLAVSPREGFDLQLYARDANLLSINVQAMEVENGFSGKIKINLSEISDLVEPSEPFSGLLQADISYYSGLNSDKNKFSISAQASDPVFTGWQAQNAQANLNGRIEIIDNGYRLAFSDSSTIKLNSLKNGENAVENMQLTLPASLSFIDGEIQFSSDQGAGMIFNKLALGGIRAEQATLNTIALNVQTKESIDHCTFKMQLTTPLVKIDDIQLRPAPIQLEGNCPAFGNHRWSVNSAVELIAYEDQNYYFSLDRCQTMLGNEKNDAPLDVNPDELGGLFSCVSSKLSGELQSHFRFNPTSNTGRATYSIASIQPDDNTPLFSSVIKNWTQPFDIVSGSLSIAGNYRWWKNSKGLAQDKLVMDLDIIEAGGHYQNILFSGLNYRDSFELLPKLNSSDFTPLNISLIDIAVPISNASAAVRFGQSDKGPLPWLRVNDLVLPLLGGQVKGNDLYIDMNAENQKLIFIVEGLDLAQIIALQQLEGLSASGRLDGYVPISISSKGVKISEGRVTAQDQGGRIQYTPVGGTEASVSVPGSDLVLQILEDLYYDSLDIDVNYDENGELDMKLAIKGTSPQVDVRRPIHFNLSLQQNLLTLLKGLRYAEGINDNIDRNVQKYFSEQKK
jgi:hypothetical protein